MDTEHIALKLLDHLDALVAYWDINQHCVFANRAFYDWFGRQPGQMLGLTQQAVLGPDIYAQTLPYIQRAYAGEVQVFERAIPSPSPGGATRHSLTTYVPDTVGGEVRGIFVHVADVTPMKALQQQLQAAKEAAEQLALHDALTGLPNRTLLHDRFAQAASHAHRSQQGIALATLDADNFKHINDSFGHGVGDQFLVEIANRARAHLRPGDTFCRIGGDEFVLLAPQTASAAQAGAMAQRLLHALRQPFAVGGVVIYPTFSLGVALFPAHGTTLAELMASSDAALYEAKRRGKDGFAFAAG